MSIETKNGEWRIQAPGGLFDGGSPSSDPYWRISDRMYIREGIYIYYIWGRLGFEGILNADWIWKLIFFFFFLGRLYQRILN